MQSIVLLYNYGTCDIILLSITQSHSYNYVVTPMRLGLCTCTRDKAIGLSNYRYYHHCLHSARSEDLGLWVSCNGNQSINHGKKLTWLGLESNATAMAMKAKICFSDGHTHS